MKFAFLPGRSLRTRVSRPAHPPVAAEALEPRTLFAVSETQTIRSITPPSFPQDSSPASLDLNGFFADQTTGLQDLTYSVTSDNTSLISTSVNGSVMTLNFGAGLSGYAHLTVVATDPSGGRASETFRVKVAASPSRSLDVTLGAGRRTFTFVEANHSSALITLVGPGSGTIHMSGDQLQLRGDHARGSNQQIESITLTGTTTATSIFILGRPARRTILPVVGDISADGPLSGVTIRNTTLDGDLTVGGRVGRTQIDSAQSGSISFGGSLKPIIVNVGSFVDENFSSGAPVSKVNAFQWVNTDSVPETFTAPYLKTLLALGNFEVGLQLSGVGVRGRTLNSVVVFGAIGGPWRVVGKCAPLNIRGTTPDWAAQFDSLSRITDDGPFSGALQVPSVNSIFIAGQMTNAIMSFTAPNTMDLGKMVVLGGMFGSAVQAVGDMGTIIAEVMQRSAVSAGVGQLATGQVLPMTPSDFAHTSTIHTLWLRPTQKVVGFAASEVAASNLGQVILGSTRTDNGGTPFGVAAVQIGSLSGRDVTHHRAFIFTNLRDPAALAAQIAARHLNLQDFQIQLVG